MASAMKDVINAAAGLTAFAIESARELVQYMVRRGQMTQDEADKLMRDVESAHGTKVVKPKAVAPAPKVEKPVKPAAVPAKPAQAAAATPAAVAAPKAKAKTAAAKPAAAAKAPAKKNNKKK
jgi:hypothetical protein